MGIHKGSTKYVFDQEGKVTKSEVMISIQLSKFTKDAAKLQIRCQANTIYWLCYSEVYFTFLKITN